MATTKYGSTWTGTYSGAANRYFRAYCTYTTSETDTTFTLSVSALGIQKTSGGQCEMVSGASKTAKLTASGASVKSGSPISKSSTALISWETGSQYKSLGSGSIVFNKTDAAQTATLTLYADKSGGDKSTAWGGKSTGTFTITIPAITRTISFDANNGSGAPSAVKGKHGSTITLPTLKPTRTGYDFLGWATSSSATSANYQSGGSYVISSDTTLYAVWHASFVAPKIEQLKAYRTDSASSAVASATGTYGYVSFAYTPPQQANSVAISVRFSTDSANKTISSPTTSGTKSAWGTNTISGSSSATIVVTVSGKTYTGASFSVSAQTYISPELSVWDAYIGGTVASFAIGGQANEGTSRFDCYLPPTFFTMAGEIKMWAGNTIPDGWLLCNGSEISKKTYPKLYAAIGDLWGTPNSSSNFKLPNLNGKVPVGYNSSDTDFATVGKSGGEKTHTLTVNEIPSHRHQQYGPYSTGSGSSGAYTQANNRTTTRVNTDYAGGSGAHNNMQPYAVIKYIICAI